MKIKDKQFWWKLIIMFLVSVAGCMLLLLVTGFIPQSAIKQNCVESAEYFEEKELFPYLIEGQFNTRQDNYADCILTNIIYHVGTGEESLPVSLIKASYYCQERQDVNVAFSEAVQGEQEANIDYFRYWHGSMVFLRPLFLVTNIVGARLVLGFLTFAFVIATVIVLWKKGKKSLAVIYPLGLVLVNSWMIGFCIEYVTTFLLMSICSFWVVMSYHEGIDRKKRNRQILCLMVISGVVACFLDFLTTETLTITVPLFIELVIQKDEKEEENKFFFLIKNGLVWGISYGAMFLLKWLLAVAVLGVQAMQEALAAAAVRLNGTVYMGETNLDSEANMGQRLIGAIFKNESVLFSFKMEMHAGTGAMIFFCLVLLGLAIVYMLRGKDFSGKTMGILLLLGCVPYLRYLVLSSHAFQHYFFTYRAQLISIMILLYLTWEYGLKNITFRHKKRSGR